jgi:muramoyltetrapeptide carboxypeptidase LdcA involved in peptidoglycan recycling
LCFRWRELKERLDVSTQNARSLEEQLAQSTHGQQLQEVNDLLASIQEHEVTVATAKEVKEKAAKDVKDLQYKIKNAKSLREKELKDAESETTRAKKSMEASQKKMKEKKMVCCLYKPSLSLYFLLDFP